MTPAINRLQSTEVPSLPRIAPTAINIVTDDGLFNFAMVFFQQTNGECILNELSAFCYLLLAIRVGVQKMEFLRGTRGIYFMVKAANAITLTDLFMTKLQL